MEDGPDLMDRGYEGPPQPPRPPQASHLEQYPPLYVTLSQYLRSNVHILVIIAAVAYFVFIKARSAYYTRNPRRTVAIVASMQEQMAQARLRQQEAAMAARNRSAVNLATPTEGVPAAIAAAVSPAPVTAPNAPQTATSRLLSKQSESATASAELQQSEATAPRPKLVPPKAQPKAQTKKPDDDSDEENGRGPRKRLPKLSGGDRAQWEAENRGGAGDGDRKNYFKRDCGPKGG